MVLKKRQKEEKEEGREEGRRTWGREGGKRANITLCTSHSPASNF
jgi:hypothetical protein